MAESYSVKAILSAADKGFTSTMKSAAQYADNLKSTLKSGLGFGIAMGAGQKAFSVISDGLGGIIDNLNESGAAWKTFQGNMEMNGKTADEIKSIKNELQDFAEQTIYSSSDMASTFAQLEAVGTKNTTKLVKGFGGLAAAAESPTQAMKTLSQQATQMAAKPKVAWEDFKLILEQTPAGISAIAKQMGKTTSQLVSDVQSGTVATEDLFDAIAEVGTNDAFTKMATQYKTVDQAMDGLTETVSNKLQPAFDTLSKYGIKAISALVDKMGDLDGEKISAGIESFVGKFSGYWSVLKEEAGKVVGAFGDAFGSIAEDVGELTGAFGSTESINNFGDAIGSASGALQAFAGFLEDHSETIAKLITNLPKIVIAFKGFQIVKSIAPGVASFTGALAGLAGKGIATLGAKLFGIAAGQKAVGAASATSSGTIIQSAAAFVAIGAGIALASAGLALLANAAVQIANAGAPAAVAMLAMVGAIAGLAVGAAALGPSLTAGAVGFVAFGAAVALVGTGALLAAASLAVVAGVLPTVSQYGTQGAVAIAALGASMIVFAAGAAAAGVASVALGAGLLVVGAAVLVASAGVLALAAGATLLGAGLTLTAASTTLLGAALPMVATGAASSAAGLAAMLVPATGLSAIMIALSATMLAFSASVVVSAAGIVAFGVGMTAACVGVLAMSVALLAVNSSMKSIKSNASSAKKSISSMKDSLDVVNEGLDALGNKAKSAINTFINQFSNAESKAKSAGRNIGNNVNDGIESGLNKLTSTVNSTMSKFNSGLSSGGSRARSTALSIASSIVSALRSAGNSSYSSGAYIGQGLANGMWSQVGSVRAAANALVAEADRAIRAKARIASPSKMTFEDGKYLGEGWVNGILSKVKEAGKAAEKLVSLPKVRSLSLAGGYGGSLSLDDSYDYSSNETYVIEVVSEIDGREISRSTCRFMKKDLETLEKSENRKKGIK